MKSLDYSSVYGLAEEIEKLKSSRLKAVAALDERRYVLELASKSGGYLLTFDLSPGQPKFYCHPVAKAMKLKKSNSPVVNFLRAHFVGKIFTGIEVAQKPDRTIRLNFEGASLTFRCFPQRAQIELLCGGKRVLQPYYSDFKPEPDLSFVAVEESASWKLNDQLAEEPADSSEAAESVVDKQKLKLEKALEKLKAADDSESDKEKASIAALEAEAKSIKASTMAKKGPALDLVFEKIKKIKTKSEVRKKRITEMQKKLLDWEQNPPLLVEQGKLKKQTKEKVFSGLLVALPSGLTMWVGRNSEQNDELVKNAQPHQTWIHLRDYQGSHGLIRHDRNQNPTDQDVQFAASVVALFSRPAKKPFADGEVLEFYVVPRKFLKKPKGGPKGFVIVERETVRRIAFKVVQFQVLNS